MITVAIADDHTLVRSGLRSLLESVEGIKIVAESSDGNDAVERVVAFGADIAVLDVGMPHLNGIEAARRIRATSGKTRIIILSMHADDEYVRAALHAGASGYILKQDAFTQLLDALKTVSEGGIYLSPVLAAKGLEHFGLGAQGKHETYSAVEKITTRERQILQLIAEGNANAEIARALGLSTRTVEAHRARIMDKLHISSTAGLTRFAIRHGLTPIDR